jgi:hypothetical protein
MAVTDAMMPTQTITPTMTPFQKEPPAFFSSSSTGCSVSASVPLGYDFS